MWFSIIGQVKSKMRMAISYLLTLLFLFPATLFADSKPHVKNVDMERVGQLINDFTLKLKKKEKLSQIIKVQRGKLSPVQRQYLMDQVGKYGPEELDLVRFSSHYGEYGFTLKHGSTLLTYDFSKLKEGKVIFNGKTLMLEDFYTKAGLEKIEKELAQIEVSHLEALIMPNAWANPVVAFVAVLLLIGIVGTIYWGIGEINCGENSPNRDFLASVDKTAKCCQAVSENSSWLGRIDDLGKKAAKAECGSEFDKLSGKNSCNSAISYYAYPACKEGNRDILEELSNCVQKAQEILEIEYLGGCQLPADSIQNPISDALDGAISQ